MANSLPLRWPAAWRDPGMLQALQTTPIRTLVVDASAPAGLAAEAARAGFQLVSAAAPPPGAIVVKGPWPGIRLSPAGGNHSVAGPTGEPWVDSNGWRVRVAKALHPDQTIWVDAKPDPSRSSLEDYLVAIADAAAHGGHWLITLDDHLAEGIATGAPEAHTTGKRIVDAAALLAAAPAAGLQEQAVIGVISTFTGGASAYAGEVLNNLARTKQQYVVLPVGHVTAATLAGLKAIVYTDSAEAPAEARKAIVDFVAGGGMLLTRPVPAGWGRLPKPDAAQPFERRQHPRFNFHPTGKGVIAEATAFADPYRMANDIVVIVSHAHDIVRFWNSGAVSPLLSRSAEGNRTTLQIVFYSLRPLTDTAVWIKGTYRTAQVRAFNQTQPQTVTLENREGGVEIHLPAVAQYALLELES